MKSVKYSKYLKPCLDIILASLLMVLFIPIILLVAALCYFNFGNPILFKQRRPGLYGDFFVIYKFRTMKDLYNINGELLSDAQRLTKFGKFLRKFSFDELPELFNVIKGDMSLVGPRPLLMEYLPLYTAEQARRHNVKPGITGWAQINGRNAIAWKEKFIFDLWYVDNINFRLDIDILWATFAKVLRCDGISYGDHVTAIKFSGLDLDSTRQVSDNE